MFTIENSWKNIVPICGNHKERVEMVINNGPHSMFCFIYFLYERKGVFRYVSRFVCNL